MPQSLWVLLLKACPPLPESFCPWKRFMLFMKYKYTVQNCQGPEKTQLQMKKGDISPYSGSVLSAGQRRPWECPWSTRELWTMGSRIRDLSRISGSKPEGCRACVFALFHLWASVSSRYLGLPWADRSEEDWILQSMSMSQAVRWTENPIAC